MNLCRSNGCNECAGVASECLMMKAENLELKNE